MIDSFGEDNFDKAGLLISISYIPSKDEEKKKKKKKNKKKNKKEE